ncbi:MAG: hypothetical protein CXR31_14790 [Geobacter sp.]|nr:MAG: hypothetical protein CXR31_14790 [Geobacter sp.]
MSHEKIVTQLSLRLIEVADSPSEIVFAISMQSVLAEIARRLGEEALKLSIEDIRLARDEVRAAIGHHLDERDFIGIGLDTWEITRNL